LSAQPLPGCADETLQLAKPPKSNGMDALPDIVGINVPKWERHQPPEHEQLAAIAARIDAR
jgi:hypothetical protein